MNSKVRLDLFNPRSGMNRGKSLLVEIVWYLVKMVFFLTPFPWPSSLKSSLLRLFGAKVGRGVIIKPRVNVHMPWKLVMGNHCWIGEEVYLLNLESIRIGNNVCISQRAFVCTGNHDYKDPTMPFAGKPITISDGVWIGAQVFVAPGTHIGVDAIVTAGSILLDNAPDGMIVGGNPAKPIKARWVD